MHCGLSKKRLLIETHRVCDCVGRRPGTSQTEDRDYTQTRKKLQLVYTLSIGYLSGNNKASDAFLTKKILII